MFHDYQAQRAETFDSFVELRKLAGLPQTARVNFLFIAEEIEPSWAPCARALQARGFETNRDDDDETLIAQTGLIEISPETIWQYERQATEIALSYAFYPDGWELVEE